MRKCAGDTVRKKMRKKKERDAPEQLSLFLEEEKEIPEEELGPIGKMWIEYMSQFSGVGEQGGPNKDCSGESYSGDAE